MEDEIEDVVVTPKLMNPHEMNVFDGRQMRATLAADFVRYFGDGVLAVAGATGGLLGAGSAGVGATAWSDAWESGPDLVRHVTNQCCSTDLADGSLNGQVGGYQLILCREFPRH